MTPAELVTLITAITGLVTAVGAVIHSVQTRAQVNASSKASTGQATETTRPGQ